MLSLSADLLNEFGLQASEPKDYGRERGPAPMPTEAQRKAVEKLEKKLRFSKKSSSSSSSSSSAAASAAAAAAGEADDFGSGFEDFNLLSRPRVILMEGKVTKKNNSSMVSSTSKRHLFLFNDVLLVTSAQTGMLSSSEKYQVHNILQLDEIFLTSPLTSSSSSSASSPGGSLSSSFPTSPASSPRGGGGSEVSSPSSSSSLQQEEEEDSCLFQISTPERSYSFIAESQSSKRIWVEELQQALLAMYQAKPASFETPGWQHHAIRGTLLSAAMRGSMDEVRMHLRRMGRLSVIGESGGGACSSSAEGVDAFDEYGMTSIHWAAVQGNTVNVELLIKAGANIDALNNGLNSPLLLAAAGGFADVFVTLLDNGADIFVRNLKDRDALFMAALYAHRSVGLPVMIESLTGKGIDLDQQDSSGATPLHECAGRNLPLPIQLLVDAGANVNKKHGLNGLTPLQISCSIEAPDAETVRTFLEKGAHPNWKDVYGKSALDICLMSFATRHSKKEKDLAKDGSSTNPETLDLNSDFVQNALPVIMELVKKGCRFAESSLAHLRPSFISAINTGHAAWMQMAEPAQFSDYVELETVSSRSADWTSDKESSHCLLCVENFTFSNRRHHCRSCGVLVCAFCSSKRLPKKESSSSKSPSKEVMQRVCDGCFNKLSYACSQRIICHAQLDKQKSIKAAAAASSSPTLSANKASLFSWGSSSASSSPSTSGKLAATSVMSDTMSALVERGQKLEQLDEKAEEMNEAASAFKSSAAALLQQQKERNGRW